MRARVHHGIDKLAADYERIAVEARPGLSAIVRDNVDHGRDLAKALAREKAGPHGKHFYKRITSEMHGGDALSGEYGPTGTPKTEFVGVGYRNGNGNTDLAKSADVLPASTSADIRKLLTRLFR